MRIRVRIHVRHHVSVGVRAHLCEEVEMFSIHHPRPVRPREDQSLKLRAEVGNLPADELEIYVVEGEDAEVAPAGGDVLSACVGSCQWGSGR